MNSLSEVPISAITEQAPRTLLDKIWASHVVHTEDGCPPIIYVDLQMLHEVTSPQAFANLAARSVRVRRPDRVIATMDHSTPTSTPLVVTDNAARVQLETLQRDCDEHGIRVYGLGDPGRGIVHVIGPEMGLTQPGMIIVCGDSHTATHGAFGALAFGVGTSEVGHVLATQCLLQQKPKSLEIRLDGILDEHVSAKDLILKVIADIGIGGGTGHAIEFTGSAVRSLTMEGRMTLCNMAIEAGARSGMVSPDDTTFEYLAGREASPKGPDWDKAVASWTRLPSDQGAQYDRSVSVDISDLEPMVTFGTNPGMAVGISKPIPDPAQIANLEERQSLSKALGYMGLEPNRSLLGHPIDVVFIGSCTNSRITDLREAADVFRGRKVAKGLRALVVPGSEAVKTQAETEGLDRVFREAGAEWREPGCSMCIAMNGDQLEPGQFSVSTSNRNFAGRQGQGGRTFLASPRTAAATAITGQVTDPRRIT